MVPWLLSFFGPLWWMWLFAPLLAAFVYVLAAKDDPKRAREVERWRKTFGPETLSEGDGYRGPPKPVAEPAVPPRSVPVLSKLLTRALEGFGLGDVQHHFELVPKLAYLSIVAANAEQSSDYQAVVAKLEKKTGPRFTLRPIPIVEGVPQANTGMSFPKDPEFGQLFVVEDLADPNTIAPSGAKAIRKWLSQPVREALLELPEVFLRVEDGAMVLGYYGETTQSGLNDLILAADAIFAEHGGGGGPSLFGAEDEEDDEPADEAATAGAKPGVSSPRPA